MQSLKHILRRVVDEPLRDALWAWRTRGDRLLLTAVLRAMLQRPHTIAADSDHLQATMAWLCAAQDATGNGGVAAFYDLRLGSWSPAYPETTGYIIPTFFDYAILVHDDSYRQRARRMGEWLLTLQLDSGAFPIGPLWPDWPRDPIVFDTGQIMQGLLRLFEESGDARYLTAARRAGDWLCAIQDEDGCWRRHTPQPAGHLHTYNVRVSWSLLWLATHAPDGCYHETAVRNLRWTLSQQEDDGWFANAGFSPDEDPLTHTIVYTIRGLLESALLLDEAIYLDAARRAADALMQAQARDGFLRARYGRGWRSDLTWSCLTGNAQAAIVWLKLYAQTQDAAYLQAAQQANESVKRWQNRAANQAGVRGGIAGSAPIYGGYEPYRYLNWAAKFFADSLMLMMHTPSAAPPPMPALVSASAN